VDAPAATARSLVFGEVALNDSTELESLFISEYDRLARVIARVIRDPGRAEEIAVDVFLKWTRYPAAGGEGAKGWLYRTAITMALDETRDQTRRHQYAHLLAVVPFLRGRKAATPEDVHAEREEQRRVRRVLSTLSRRDASLLVLRSDGFSYAETATILRLNAASVGTLLRRAQRAFKQEYTRRYGNV
jgi:RNA polymerase sigma-70 factor, ECF subfamily